MMFVFDDYETEWYVVYEGNAFVVEKLIQI